MTSRRDNALNQFLTEHFAAQREARKPKPIEPLPPPPDHMADVRRFMLQQNEFIRKMFEVPPDALVGQRLRIKLPPTKWRLVQ